MLRINMSSSADAAMSYFREGLSRGEYYMDQKILNQEVVGLWGGKAAEMLKLKGGVDRESFEPLCTNLHPQTGSWRRTPKPAFARVGPIPPARPATLHGRSSYT